MVTAALRKERFTSSVLRNMTTHIRPTTHGHKDPAEQDTQIGTKQASGRVWGISVRGQRPMGAIDWLFASMHSSQLMRTLVGGRFGHKYWCSGWGDPHVLATLCAMQTQRFAAAACGSLYRNDAVSVAKDIRWKCLEVHTRSGVSVWQGEFRSPVTDGTLPPESLVARCQLILPRGRQPLGGANLGLGRGMRAYVHLAGLGDYSYLMRRLMMWPLARDHEIASFILQSPFYGERKPAQQRGAKLEHVADLLAVGNATIEETLLALQWLREHQFGPIGVCGFSMGGVHAMMAAAVDRQQKEDALALVCFAAPHSAGSVFCHGPLSHACDWEALRGGGGGDTIMSEHAVRSKLDEVLGITDIRRLPAPRYPKGIILVQAAEDAYIDSSSELLLRQSWHHKWRHELLHATPPPESVTSPPKSVTPPHTDTTARAHTHTHRTGHTHTHADASARAHTHTLAHTMAGTNTTEKIATVDEYGVETAWVRGGHVTSFFTQHATFRRKLVAAVERLPQRRT